MPKNENLDKYWTKYVAELATVPAPTLSAGLKERHRLYSLGLMSIVYYYWNGLKKGRDGTYPLNPVPTPNSSKWLRDDYRGHNIAALAVDRKGAIMDFEFNHNRLLNSSAEHAEARLVRRIYSLTQVNDSWDVTSDPNPAMDDYSTFSEVTLYTSLESCSQCSGVMALARVKEVIYLQTDPGMYMVGNILRNLTEKTPLESPRPVPASAFDFNYFTALDAAFEKFAGDVVTSPFYLDPKGKPDNAPSITSFLCTAVAYALYEQATQELSDYATGIIPLQFPKTKPLDRDQKEVTNGLTNADALKEITDFRDYAIQKGRRGTPHHG
jgi:tRNA(Arg) A34 adenosine deaminase TadA